VSALAELVELRGRVEQARRSVEAAQADQSRAGRRLSSARAAVRDCDPADADRMAQLTTELARVQAEVQEVLLGEGSGARASVRDVAADARYTDAAQALVDAEAAVETWRWTRAEDAAAELRDQARDLIDRYRPVAAEVQKLEREFAALVAIWHPLLEPLGLTGDDMPESPAVHGRFSELSPPMPFALQRPEERTREARGKHERIQDQRREAQRRAEAEAGLAAEAEAASAGGPRVDPVTGQLEAPATA
jgi:hypothetical protein